MTFSAPTDTLGSPHRFNSMLLESFKVEINAIAVTQLPASRLARTQLWGLLKGKLLKIRYFFHFYYCCIWARKGNTKSLWRKHLFISKSSWSSAGHCLAKSCSSQHCTVARQPKPPPIANQHLLLLSPWKKPVEISLEMEEQNKEKKLIVPSAPTEAKEQRLCTCQSLLHCNWSPPPQDISLSNRRGRSPLISSLTASTMPVSCQKLLAAFYITLLVWLSNWLTALISK